MDTTEGRLAAIASLNEPLRRRVYHYVTAQSAPVSRDGAAGALGVARSVAAFHLDKLAKLGLLDVEFRRPPGRRGPGAGRPAKFYRRSDEEISVSVPERRYDLAAELLARAVEGAADGSTSVAEALGAVAREEGRMIGNQVDRLPVTSSTPIERVTQLLAENGYEPQVNDGMVTLVNCPFHALAEEHRDLVCAMNHELIKGVLDATGLADTTARLDPAPGRCCVTLVT